MSGQLTAFVCTRYSWLTLTLMEVCMNANRIETVVLG